MKPACLAINEKCNLWSERKVKYKENLVDQVIDDDVSFDGSWQKEGIHQRMELHRQYWKIMDWF